ncbi:alpha/beta hydrolase [Pedobacter glucosidilyticus]|uniref:alpha/beta hydrolase n=1 Tax=Pedobacter glucosidilyticus TaxID=1122941 RepID=UPI0003FC10B7|nr:alpha/beta hydrolase [Pedobacter glucosidilyticus]
MLKFKLILLNWLIVGNVYGQKMEVVFLDKTDSTRNNYTIIYPENKPYSGLILILPGFGHSAELTLEQTDLPLKTAKKGLLTVIPTLHDGVFSFGVDILSQKSLNNIVEDLRNKYKLSELPFYIGGFSIGGSCAIKYAQSAKIKPTAVFAVDPPLDFERFYNSSKRDIRLSVNKEPSPENMYMVERIEKEFNGTPQTALRNFHEISPYSFSDYNQTAVKKFGNIPLRIYTEPDVDWWLKERSFDFFNMNAPDCSAMINELNRLGNHKAELIVTKNMGYRKPNHVRHPHSWSIVNHEDLLIWLNQQKKLTAEIYK